MSFDLLDGSTEFANTFHQKSKYTSKKLSDTQFQDTSCQLNTWPNVIAPGYKITRLLNDSKCIQNMEMFSCS